MKFSHTTRWITAGAAFGLSVAIVVGVAFAVYPGSAALTASKGASVTTTPGTGFGTGSLGGSTGMMGYGSTGYGTAGSSRVSHGTASSPGTGFGMGSLGGSTGMMGSGSTGSGATGYGMMGSSMIGGGAGSRGTVSNTALAALVSRGEKGATIDSSTNTVTYKGHAVTLVALASPHGKPNMTWEIDGLVNPTVVVQPKAQLDVVLVNTDWGYMHGFELTTTPPPYPYMSMAGIVDNFFLMPLPPRSAQNTATATYYTESASFTATSGTYHYLCPVPGHAAAGMFGTFIVG